MVLVNLEFEDYPEKEWIEELYLAGAKPELLCDFAQKKCLNFVYENLELASELINDNKGYIKRYDGLLNFNKFELYAKPSYSLPMMKFGPSLDILKLKLMSLFQKVKDKNYKDASDELSKLVLFNKNVLEKTPYIMPKVVSLVELELILNSAAYLISNTDNNNISDWSSFISTLNQLTSNQLKFDKPLFGEFVSQVNALDIIEQHDLSNELPTFIKYLPLRLLYKRNRSINMLFDAMTVNMGKTEIVGKRIVTQDKGNNKDMLAFDYRNAIGSLLIMASTPKFLDLEDALYNLEVKQRMIKHLFFVQKTGSEHSTFKSPYTGIVATLEDEIFCTAPLESEDNNICITAF